MPIVEIKIASGRTPEQLRDLLAEVHSAVQRAVDVPPASIRVIVREVDPRLWLSGGQSLAEKAVLPR